MTDDPGRIIAVCGKGGAGKTTVTALLGLTLAEQGRRVLFVDADHAGGLAMALGLSPAMTLEQVRQEAAAEYKARSATRDEAARALDYLLLQALGERGRAAFLGVGRPEGRGCYCGVNKLLREAIAALAREFDVTLVDAEAGVEQASRDVVGDVDRLLLVSDTSAKGLHVAQEIARVRADLGNAGAPRLLVNRVQDAGDVAAVVARTALPVLGAVPEDPAIRRADAEQRPLHELCSSAARDAVAALAETIL